MATIRESGRLRIGELSRRHAVTPDVLRVWERRYGLLRPERTEGGFRLYTFEDHLGVGVAEVLQHAAGVGAAGSWRAIRAASRRRSPRAR